MSNSKKLWIFWILTSILSFNLWLYTENVRLYINIKFIAEELNQSLLHSFHVLRNQFFLMMNLFLNEIIFLIDQILFYYYLSKTKAKFIKLLSFLRSLFRKILFLNTINFCFCQHFFMKKNKKCKRNENFWFNWKKQIVYLILKYNS